LLHQNNVFKAKTLINSLTNIVKKEW